MWVVSRYKPHLLWPVLPYPMPCPVQYCTPALALPWPMVDAHCPCTHDWIEAPGARRRASSCFLSGELPFLISLRPSYCGMKDHVSVDLGRIQEPCLGVLLSLCWVSRRCLFWEASGGSLAHQGKFRSFWICRLPPPHRGARCIPSFYCLRFLLLPAWTETHFACILLD